MTAGQQDGLQEELGHPVHFRWDGPRLAGRTRTGRATVAVLAINDPAFVALREALIATGHFPPA